MCHVVAVSICRHALVVDDICGPAQDATTASWAGPNLLQAFAMEIVSKIVANSLINWQGYSTLQQYEVQSYDTPLWAPIQHTMQALDGGGMFSLDQNGRIFGQQHKGLVQRTNAFSFQYAFINFKSYLKRQVSIDLNVGPSVKQTKIENVKKSWCS